MTTNYQIIITTQAANKSNFELYNRSPIGFVERPTRMMSFINGMEYYLFMNCFAAKSFFKTKLINDDIHRVN